MEGIQSNATCKFQIDPSVLFESKEYLRHSVPSFRKPKVQPLKQIQKQPTGCYLVVGRYALSHFGQLPWRHLLLSHKLGCCSPRIRTTTGWVTVNPSHIDLRRLVYHLQRLGQFVRRTIIRMFWETAVFILRLSHPEEQT